MAEVQISVSLCKITINVLGERTGLVVRALDSGSGDPGSILGRVGVLLAHLSRRLIGELIVYKGIRRPSVRRPSVCQHFQTTSPLKP